MFLGGGGKIINRSSIRLPGCFACDEPGTDPIVIQENGHDGYKCSDCGLIYIAPRPDLSYVVNLYDHDSAQVSAQEWIDAYNSIGKALKARLTLRQIRKHRSTGALLEIGPGGGAFLRQARKYFRTYAAEFNTAQVQHLKAQGLECRRGQFDEVFRGHKFDVIYFCDVVSHLADPVADLRTMRSMLNPGGIVMLETGNYGDMDQKYYPLVDRWQYPDHLYFFSDRSLENLAESSGFKIETKLVYSRLVETVMDGKLKGAKSAAKNQRRAETSMSTLKRKLIHFAMTMKHAMDYYLIYRLGAILPKRGRPQTVIAILSSIE